MLADIITGIARSEQRPPAPYYPRPSLAGPERCLRQLVYMAHGAHGEQRPGRATLTLDDSSWHEELTADWLAKSVYQIHSRQMPVEVPAPGLMTNGMRCDTCQKDVPPGVLHGHLDWIMTDPMGRDYLVEHKAINRYGFDRCLKGHIPLDYITQACLYLRGARAIALEPIYGPMVLIKCKDTARYLEYHVDYVRDTDTATVVQMVQSHGDAPAVATEVGLVIPGITESAIARFREVEEHVVLQTLPPRPYELGTTFPCGYCPFEATCWDSYAAEFEALTDDQQLDTELADLARLYLEVSGHASEMEKEKDALRTKIRAALDLAQVKGGVVGEYTVMRSLRERTSWDEEQIPPVIAARAKQVNRYEVLTIRKRKEKR